VVDLDQNQWFHHVESRPRHCHKTADLVHIGCSVSICTFVKASYQSTAGTFIQWDAIFSGMKSLSLMSPVLSAVVTDLPETSTQTLVYSRTVCKYGPPLLMKTSPALTLQLWEWIPSLDSQLIALSDLHWTHTTHHGIGTELDFLVVTLNTIYGKQEILSVWMYMSESKGRFVWQFPNHDSLCLQVSMVGCSWWNVWEAWGSLGKGLWDIHVQSVYLP
jgi:hypothetical protein